MRRLLLDTHTFLWWLIDDRRLGSAARALIAEANNQVFVSAATAWEISIKKSLGKLEAPDDLDSVVEDEGFDRLAISFFHGERAGVLPQLHRDPFDRMLVAQSQAEGLEIITADESIRQYGVKTLDATK
jgi:PIN domain nuclease of toxin-antitoxin system